MENQAIATDIFQEQVVECEKVCESFEYFLDEYVWIEDKVSKEAIDLKLWPAQREKIADLFLHRLLIILKAHQLGYTWIFVAAYCLWRAITEPLHHIVINSFNEDVGVEILKRLDFILDRIPTWMYPPIGQSQTQLKEFLHYDEAGRKIPSIIQVIPATEKGAQSKTPTILIVDESAQNRYVGKTYVASKPGIDMAEGQIIIISNSIKDAPGWPFTKTIYTDSVKGLNTFHRVFLPWWANPNRPKNFKEIQLNEGMDEDDFSQRYPESESEAISTMLGSYFGKVLAKHDNTIKKGIVGNLEIDPKDPQEKKIIFTEEKHGILEIWAKPVLEWTFRYVVGSDVSEGLGQTYSVAYVYDRVDKVFVARLRSNRIDADIWGYKLIELGKYYDEAMIGWETNGAGITTTKRLTEDYSNLFYHTVPGKIKGQMVNEYGWHETNENKHNLAGDLKSHFRETFSSVSCAILIDECSTFIRHENGKLEHEEGKLDDCVIAGGITVQVSQSLPPAYKGEVKVRTPAEKHIDEIESGAKTYFEEEQECLGKSLTEFEEEYHHPDEPEFEGEIIYDDLN